MCYCAFVSNFSSFTGGMALKETPKKVYPATNTSIDSSACRLCRAVGDTSHRKNIFKPSNRTLLKIAEQICGHPIVYEVNLPHLICRPCKRRLNNTVAFQKIIVETEQLFHQSQSSQSRFKRCVEVFPNHLVYVHLETLVYIVLGA